MSRSASPPQRPRSPSLPRPRSRSRSPTPTRTRSPSPNVPPTINRHATTPFLLHLSYRASAYHNLTDFPVPSPNNPSPRMPSHLQVYTWMSCSLRELALLLTSSAGHLGVFPEEMGGCRIGFRLVYPDLSMKGAGYGGRLDGEVGRGRYIGREMGSVVVGAPLNNSNGTATGDGNGDTGNPNTAYELSGPDAEKTLEDLKFVIGDYIDCAIFPPLSDGSVVGRGSAGFGGTRGARDNGFSGSRGRGGFGRGRGDYAQNIPSGEWRRGERVPEAGGGGYRDRDWERGGGGGFGGGRGRGRY